MTFPTSTPSEHGIDPHRLLRFVEALDTDPGIEPHGLIVQSHGHRVLETYWSPHRAGQARLVYSLSKSFAGAALGLALEDGLLSLDDRVVDHLPLTAIPDAGIDERTARMTVRHLASMASGHADETLLRAFMTDPTDLVRAFLGLPPEHEPGTWFAYNQPTTLTLSAILSHLTGKRLTEQLRVRLLDLLGIENFYWTQYRTGVDVGFSGVFTDLDGIARLGQLHLDRGVWNGRQLLSSDWVDMASTVQIDNSQRLEPDWRRGYGFQLWMCRHGYRGDGAYGQYMIVLPEWNTVVAFFSCTGVMQTVMDHVWDLLLPALDGAGSGVTVDPRGDAELFERTSGLHVPTAAERLGSTAALPGEITGSYRPSPDGRSHDTITGIEVRHDELVVHEGEVAITFPLGRSWAEAVGYPLAASTTVDTSGALHIDIATLASPHRIEVVTDPTTKTFSATWPLAPMFGLGLDRNLSRIRPPV